MNIRKKCAACNKYFDEHDGSEIFICPSCKDKYVDDEQKRIIEDVKNRLRSEIKDAFDIKTRISYKSDNYNLTYDGLCVAVNVGTINEEMTATISLDPSISYSYDDHFARETFDLSSPKYLANIIEWTKKEIDRYDAERLRADAILYSAEELDDTHTITRRDFISKLMERWNFAKTDFRDKKSPCRLTV